MFNFVKWTRDIHKNHEIAVSRQLLVTIVLHDVASHGLYSICIAHGAMQPCSSRKRRHDGRTKFAAARMWQKEQPQPYHRL